MTSGPGEFNVGTGTATIVRQPPELAVHPAKNFFLDLHQAEKTNRMV
jgi:hypothetical protein